MLARGARIVRRVVVIGGGVIGLTSALFLAREGFNTTLVESRSLFSGASGANLGILSYSLGLIDGLDPSLLRRALSTHRKLAEELGHSIKTSEIVVPLTEAKAIIRELTRGFAAVFRAKYGFKRVEKLGLSLVVDDTLLIDPLEYRDSLRRKLEELGVEVIENNALEKLTSENNRITSAVLSSGIIESDVYVLAIGPWSDTVLRPLGIELGVEPVKGYTILARVEENIDKVIGVDPVFMRPHQHRDDIVMIGGYKKPSGLSLDIDERDIRIMLDTAVRVGVKPLEVLEIRVGLRPCLEEPVTRIVKYDNLIISTGHCRHGMLLAPQAAEEIVRLARSI